MSLLPEAVWHCLPSGSKVLFCAGSYLTVAGAGFPVTNTKVTPLSRAGLVPGDNWDHLGDSDKEKQEDFGLDPERSWQPA